MNGQERKPEKQHGVNKEEHDLRVRVRVLLHQMK